MPTSACFLLVEDREEDIVLVRRSFVRAKVLNPLQVVTSGAQAIAYLSGTGLYTDRLAFPMPSLVLLDLQMPGIDGFAVLKWIRQREALKELHVVILSSSDAMRDVSAAYRMGANSFLIKPIDFERFVEISQALGGFWLWHPHLPDLHSSHDAQFNQSQNRPKGEPIRQRQI